MDFGVKIGHTNLAKSFNGTGEHFVALVEALDRQGVQQHIIVRNESLARRLAVCENVNVGPTTGSPVIAYCLMPQVDIVHAHDERSAQAGLLLALTRSLPYVLTRRQKMRPGSSPVMASTIKRAAAIICTFPAAAKVVLEYDPATRVDIIQDISRSTTRDIDMLGNRIAADHLRLYHRVVESSHIPALLL